MYGNIMGVAEITQNRSPSRRDESPEVLLFELNTEVRDLIANGFPARQTESLTYGNIHVDVGYYGVSRSHGRLDGIPIVTTRRSTTGDSIDS